MKSSRRGHGALAALLLWMIGCAAPADGTLALGLHGGVVEDGYSATGAYLSRDAESSPWRFRCGATLIAADLAVTAAHCVDASAAEHGLYYGDVVGGEVPATASVHRSRVIVVHPRLNWQGSYKNDVAVMVLEEAITDRGPATIADYDLGCDYRAIGYGPDDSGELGHRRSTPMCIESVDGDRGVLHTVLPAGAAEARLVVGDSGGPLYVEGSHDLVAFLSFTANSSNGQWWGQHTAVAERREFIDCVDTYRSQWAQSAEGGSGAPARATCGICVDEGSLVALGSRVGAGTYAGTTDESLGPGVMSVKFKDCVQAGERKYDDYWFKPPPIRRPVAETALRWTAPRDGEYWFTAMAAEGSAFDPMIYAYGDEGLNARCMDPRTPTLCNDDRFDGGNGAQVRRRMAAGEAIYLVVDGSTWSDAVDDDAGDWTLAIGTAEVATCLPEGPDVLAVEDFRGDYLAAPAPAVGTLHRSLALVDRSSDAAIELDRVGSDAHDSGQRLRLRGQATLRTGLPAGTGRFATISQEMNGDGAYAVVAAGPGQTAVLFQWIAATAMSRGQPPVATIAIPEWAEFLELRVESAPGASTEVVIRALGVHTSATPTCAPHRVFLPHISG